MILGCLWSSEVAKLPIAGWGADRLIGNVTRCCRSVSGIREHDGKTHVDSSRPAFNVGATQGSKKFNQHPGRQHAHTRFFHGCSDANGEEGVLISLL
jgi:hypothetical protein